MMKVFLDTNILVDLKDNCSTSAVTNTIARGKRYQTQVISGFDEWKDKTVDFRFF